MSNRNIDMLSHIIRQCDDMRDTIDYFGKSFESLNSNRIYKNAVAICLLQIGESVSHLSSEFKTTFHEMLLSDMGNVENTTEHQYDKLDVEALWEAISVDIPALRDCCEQIIQQHAILEQEVRMIQYDDHELAY